MAHDKQQCRVMNCLTTGTEAYCHPPLTSMPTNMYINRVEYVPQGFYTTAASPPLSYYSVAENGGLRNRHSSMVVVNGGAGLENLAGTAPLSDGRCSGSSDNNNVAGDQETEAVYAVNSSDIPPNSSSPISELNASKQPQLSLSHVYGSPAMQESNSSSTTTSSQGGSLTAIEREAEISAAMTQLKVEGHEDLCTRTEIHA